LSSTGFPSPYFGGCGGKTPAPTLVRQERLISNPRLSSVSPAFAGLIPPTVGGSPLRGSACLFYNHGLGSKLWGPGY
jgi:hypothetical protein